MVNIFGGGNARGLVLGFMAAAAVLFGIVKQQADTLRETPDDKLPQAAAGAVRLTVIFSSIGTAGFAGMGIWFWWLGRKIARAGRYPPPSNPSRRRTSGSSRTTRR